MTNRSIFQAALRIEREFDEPLREVVAGFVPMGLTRIEVAETLAVNPRSLRTFCEKTGVHFPRNQPGRAERLRGTANGRARIVKFRGRRQCISDIARENGINVKTLHTRLSRGWPLDRAIA